MSDNNMPQQYINTPFAYTKLSKNLSLLQQSVLVKVSEHIQTQVQLYFGSDLCKSRDVPRPLFSSADKANGIPVFFVSYAELGVAVNNYQMARAAIKEVMELTIHAPGKDDDGNPSLVAYSIFSKVNASTSESNGIAFTLNPEVIDYVFDMSQGYVRHPANIAQIGQVERMPMMYYYLFKRSERWKNREVHLTVEEIKDYFGMRKVVTAGNEERRGRPQQGDVLKEAYPKFSKFNKSVLARSIDDINRLRHDNLIDICVSYEPVYVGKKKVGNPAFIRFCIYDTIEEMMKAHQNQPDLFISTNTANSNMKPGEAEWGTFLANYQGPLADVLHDMPFHSYDAEKKFVAVRASRQSEMEFNKIAQSMTADQRRAFFTSMEQAYGQQVDFKFFG